MKTKTILTAMATACSLSTVAQMVVTDPTLEYVTLETKIETASNWVKQLEGVTKTLQAMREQAAKLDSSKRAVEKAYQLQEKVRKDAETNYAAVQKMSMNNLYHITQNYLGFSINPASYLPDMPALAGYSDFRKSAYYDPYSKVDPSTLHIDRFLSSVRMTSWTDSMAIGADNPLQNYYQRLYDMNSLAGAYGKLNTSRKRHNFDRMYLKIIPRLQNELANAEALLDSTENPSDVVALTVHISELNRQLEAAIKERNEMINEQVEDAVRSANIQRIAQRKQEDILTMLAVSLAGYSHNKGFSLRKLAAARKKEESEVRQGIKKSLSSKKTGAIISPRQANTGGFALASANPLMSAYTAVRAWAHKPKPKRKSKEEEAERVVIVIDCSD